MAGMSSRTTRSTKRRRERLNALEDELRRRGLRFKVYADQAIPRYDTIELRFGYVRLASAPRRPSTHVIFRELYINPLSRGRGLGTRVLRTLCRAADATGVTLRLMVKPFGFGQLLDREELADWYARFGFADSVSKRGHMVRPPVRIPRVFPRKVA